MRAIPLWRSRGQARGARHKTLVFTGKTLGKGTYGTVTSGAAFWRGKKYRVAIKRFVDMPDAHSWCLAARAGVYSASGPVVPSLMVRLRLAGECAYVVLMPVVPVAAAGHRRLPDLRGLGPSWRCKAASDILRIPAQLRRFPGPSHASYVDLGPANIGAFGNRVLAIDPDSVIFPGRRSGWYGTFSPWLVSPAPRRGATPREVDAFDEAFAEWVDDDRRQLMLTQWAAFATAAAVVSPEFGRGELATPSVIWRCRERLAHMVAAATAKPGLPRWLAFFEKQWALELSALDRLVASSI